MADVILSSRVLDNGLSVLDTEADKIVICSGDPTSYSDATTAPGSGGKYLAGAALTQGTVFGGPAAASPDGRKVTSVAVSGSVDNTGTAARWAVLDTTASRLLAYGSFVGGPSFTAGQTWSLDPFTIRIPASAPVVGYTAQGVRFDGTNDYMERGGALSGVSNSKVGICSFWIKMMAGDGNFHVVFEDGASAGVCLLFRNNDNTFKLSAGGGGGTAVDITSTSTFTAGGSWKHLLWAWDAAAGTRQLYVNDANDSPTVSGGNFTVDWTTPTDWGFGERKGGGPTLLTNAEIADFYLNTAAFLDMSNSANRRLFISAGGAPVDLGSDGSTPTGSAPTLFFHGSTASWQTNDGSGGGFTLTGTLTDASSNPP